MKSRYVVRLFFSTLLIGGLVSGFIGFIVQWGKFQSYFTDFDFKKILSTWFWLFGVGMIFSVISQMGFFAYLTIHRFGLGFFKGAGLWNAVQVVLILFVFFDLVYLRYTSFGEGGGLLPFIAFAFVILIVALVTALIKAKMTNKGAFVPALFFMFAVTVIELVPVLRVNDTSWIYLMLFPLLICNMYQILILHKLNQKSAQS